VRPFKAAPTGRKRSVGKIARVSAANIAPDYHRNLLGLPRLPTMYSMGYQALLFCPDEKNARVVTQVLTELDFSVDTAAEPFGAVKKLMAQHFDAIVVDCENEQNASLLFRSARNSVSNQSSLAVAVVEGQAGVAKAFRIGANLVLTKPINLEQSKGTLRVARGLLRKGDAGNSVPVPSLPAEPSGAPAIAGPGAKSRVVPRVPTPQAAAPSAAVAAQASQSAKRDTSDLFEPVAQSGTIISGRAPILARNPGAQSSPPTPIAKAKPSTTSAIVIETTTGETIPTNAPLIPGVRGQGAAAAAPAREVLFAGAARSETPAAASSSSVPSFAGLDETQEETSSTKNGFTIAIVVIVVTAVAAYFSSRHPKKTVEPAANGQVQTVPMAATATTAAAPAPGPKAQEQATAGTATQSHVARQSSPGPAKPSPSVKSARAEPAEEDEPVVATKAVPMKVKSDLPRPAEAKTAPEEQPTAPAPLNIAGSADDKAMSNLVAAAPMTPPKPAPEVLNISQGVTQGLLIRRVQPVYPPQALAMRIQGSVQLKATISKDGSIRDLKSISGQGALSRAAMEAVRQWKYKPYYLDGQPVEIQTQITINFKLPN
jgi:periplasmic protein TonB